MQMVLQHCWTVIIKTGAANPIDVNPFPGFGFMPFLRKQESRGVWGKVDPGSKLCRDDRNVDSVRITPQNLACQMKRTGHGNVFQVLFIIQLYRFACRERVQHNLMLI